MKRFLLVLLAIVMAVTLCSCGGDKKEDTKKTEDIVAVSSTKKVETAVTASTAEKVETTQSESGNTTESENKSNAPKTQSELIVGTWVAEDAVNYENEPVYNFMTFTGDGFAFSGNGDGYERTRYTIAWKIESDKLELTLTDINYGDTATRSFDFTLTEDELTISNRPSEDEESVLFKGTRQNPQIAELVTRASGIITSGDYSYCKLVNDTTEIIKYSGTAAELEIPAELDGLMISVIGREAFEECDNLVKVTIPDCVTSIGKNAFRYCESLTEINIPGSVTSIGKGAFYECKGLKKVMLSEGVTCIVENMFYACMSLTDITIPDSVTVIESSAFSICESLTSVIIPDSVTEIGSSAFWGCERLESIKIPSSVIAIGSGAFGDCGKQTELRFTVISVLKGSYAEEYCQNNRLRYAYYEKEDTTDAPTGTASLEPLEYVTFGHYPQIVLGKDSTEIEWLVLAREGNKVLLLSRYALDAKPYNTTKTDVTWETCTLRTWLNNDFIKKAFTNEEQAAILTTNVDNSKSQCFWRNTNGGNDTQDRVFLLSIAEADKYMNVVNGGTNNMKARTSPTEYVIGLGVFTSSVYTSEDKRACYWWLRSPGCFQKEAAYVNIQGYMGSENVDYKKVGVRPALWVNMESLSN